MPLFDMFTVDNGKNSFEYFLKSRPNVSLFFQGKSLVDDEGEVGFRSDLHISSDGYKGKFKPCFYDYTYSYM